MFGIHDLWLFFLSGLLVNIMPGPDTIYITGRSIQLGWRGGAAAAIGIGCGCLVHIFAAAIGLSAVLAASSAAFTVVKTIGVVYLCFMGIQMLRTRSLAIAVSADDSGPVRLRTVFWQGAITNVLNPKVALFFLAFLPQFVATDSSSKAVAFMLLGILFNVNGTIWNLILAVFAAKVAHRVKKSERALVWINRSLGALFLYLGFRVAIFEVR